MSGEDTGANRPERRPAWRAPAIATGLAALALLLLLLPGVLRVWIRPVVAPPRTTAVQVPDNDRQMQQQIAELERHLALDVCRVDGNQLPRLQPIERSTPPADPAQRSGTTPAPTDQPERYSAPVAPERARVPEGAAAGQAQAPSNLAELIERATVLVVTESGMGSGFFVSATHVLTNAHVIGEAREAWVGNKSFTRLVQSEVVARLFDGQPGGRDFALLRLKSGQGPAHLSLSDTLPAKLQNVIAAGYPAFVLRSDPSFQRLLQGDTTGIPEPSLTQGAVQTVQRPEADAIIVHRASISSGNSGGPLTDECGVVVGVNTFVAAPGEGTDRQFFSQGAGSAIEFLRANNITPQVVSGQRCVTGAQAATRGPDNAPQTPPAAPAAVTPAPVPQPAAPLPAPTPSILPDQGGGQSGGKGGKGPSRPNPATPK